MKHRILTPLLAALLLMAPAAYSQTTLFTYQGRLTDNSLPANGNYDVHFALHSTATLGTSIAAQTINPLQVTNGMFTAQLDFGSLFNGADRWLEIHVRPSGSTGAYTAMVPRQRFTSAPYAIRAGTAGQLAGNLSASQISGGTLNPSLIADGALGGAKLTAGAVTATQLGAGSVTATHLTANSVGSTQIAAGAVTASEMDPAIGLWNKSGTSISYLAGNVGIGTATPTLASFVVNNAVNFNSALFGSIHPLSLQQSHPALGFNCYYSGAGGIVNIHTGGTGNNFAGLFGMDPYTGRFYIDTTSGSTTNQTAVTRSNRLSILNSGAMGLGTTSPTGALLDVEGAVRINDNNLWLRGGTDTGHGLGWYGAGKTFGGRAIDGPALFGWGGGVLGTAPGDTAVAWDWAGNVDVGTAVRAGTFNVVTGGNKALRITNDGFVPGIQAVSTDGADTYAGYMRMRHAIEIWPKPDGSAGAKLDVRDASGNPTISFDGASGEGTMRALNLTGGSDVAEPIRMDEDVPPGAAVVINADRPGEVKLSTTAYDTCVAGIVSGANGVKPGLSLRQEGVLDGGKNVALTGRVYAMADADAAPIKPGDLLVTSDVPGHVMKAQDRERSHGAILGKAMTPLAGGTGYVLVLVNLQ